MRLKPALTDPIGLNPFFRMTCNQWGSKKNGPLLDLQKNIEEKKTSYIYTMTSRAAGQCGSRSRKDFEYDPKRIIAADEKPAGVRESAVGLAKNEKIESLLTDIVSRLDRIEEKIDENVYPPESAIKPELIRNRVSHSIPRSKASGGFISDILSCFT
jgi:hypothetical protein